MTDPHVDEVDARLKAAGQRWRASEPVGLTVDIESSRVAERHDAVTRARWRRWLIPASAVAAVLAVTLGVVLAGSVHRTTRSLPATGLAALAVGNGDLVRATGEVFRSAHGIQLCTNIAFAGTAGATIPPLPMIDCGRWHVVDLSGVEAREGGIVPTGTNNAPRSGEIQVTGRLHGDTITVESIAAAPQTALPPGITPCAAPAGGWQPVNGLSGIGDTDSAHTYVSDHPAQFGAFWVSRPRGGPNYPNAEGGRGPLEVMTVGTVNDPGQIRSELAAFFHGPLCVYAVTNSYAEMSAALATARAALGNQLLDDTRDEINNTELLKPRYLTLATAATLANLGDRVTVKPLIVPA